MTTGFGAKQVVVTGAFDDLRAGKWPKATDEEIKARDKALELAQSVHDKLDIRPLTTATIVRQLREGKEDRD
jgi:formiminotetrahydrofolate cyclodeaminase